ncbi:hypothetical protein VRK_36460 [Vibrio sp. MEBiC08052]|nr:hypothetical protein VRK_36460 [Vibrio sp. MEBiC08052]
MTGVPLGIALFIDQIARDACRVMVAFFYHGIDRTIAMMDNRTG